MPAMPKHPISGIPGSKPRVEPGPGSRRGELTDEYIAARNRGQLAKAELAEIALLEKKGTLISKQLAERRGGLVL